MRYRQDGGGWLSAGMICCLLTGRLQWTIWLACCRRGWRWMGLMGGGGAVLDGSGADARGGGAGVWGARDDGVPGAEPADVCAVAADGVGWGVLLLPGCGECIGGSGGEDALPPAVLSGGDEPADGGGWDDPVREQAVADPEECAVPSELSGSGGGGGAECSGVDRALPDRAILPVYAVRRTAAGGSYSPSALAAGGRRGGDRGE